MSSITITNPSSHSQIPWEVQREMKDLELPLASPFKFQTVGPETAGSFELRRSYDVLCEASYTVSRAMMLHVATIKERHQLIAWIKDSGVDMFFFTADSCTYNP